MNTKAIERIKGYCCEVTQEQWDELVKVADEVGVKVGNKSRECGVTESDKIARYNKLAGLLGVYCNKYDGQEIIPFPEFLAKLKGDEQWQPKAGEMVEVSNDDFTTYVQGIYIGYDDRWGNHVIRIANYIEYVGEKNVRKSIPTITRTEAEAILNKRIIN
jgi:hypothetical protein